MNSETIRLAQELKRSINADIYQTGFDSKNSDDDSSPEKDNIQIVESKYLKNLMAIYKSSAAILSGKSFNNPELIDASNKTLELTGKFFNNLRDIIPNISEEDKIEYNSALENYFRIYPWVIRNELEIP